MEQRVGQLAVVADRDLDRGAVRQHEVDLVDVLRVGVDDPLNGALSAFFVFASSTPESGVNESMPIRSTTSTV